MKTKPFNFEEALNSSKVINREGSEFTTFELVQKLEELKTKYDSEKFAIIKSYCDANNPYKVGDVFTDHLGSILIKKISYQGSLLDSNNYYCTYFGFNLKKDGTIRKDNSERWAHQCNDINKKIK